MNLLKNRERADKTKYRWNDWEKNCAQNLLLFSGLLKCFCGYTRFCIPLANSEKNHSHNNKYLNTKQKQHFSIEKVQGNIYSKYFQYFFFLILNCSFLIIVFQSRGSSNEENILKSTYHSSSFLFLLLVLSKTADKWIPFVWQNIYYCEKYSLFIHWFGRKQKFAIALVIFDSIQCEILITKESRNSKPPNTDISLSLQTVRKMVKKIIENINWQHHQQMSISCFKIYYLHRLRKYRG